MPIPKKRTDIIPKTARERVYLGLKGWIEDNTLKPGEKINDVEIASYFEVSRTPVREAMQLLADQKLIDITPGKDSRVSLIDFDTIRQIYDMLAELNSLAIKCCFEKITPASIRKLEEINVKISQNPRDFVPLDHQFHEIILDASDNDFLRDFCHILQIHSTRFQLLLAEKGKFDPTESINGHKKIIDALKKKDMELARSAMYKNYEFINDNLVTYKKICEESCVNS